MTDLIISMDANKQTADYTGIPSPLRGVRGAAYTIITPLGFSMREAFAAMLNGKTGLQEVEKPYLSHPVFASLFSEEQQRALKAFAPAGWSRFEQLLYRAAKDVIDDAGIQQHLPDTALVVASTKGNIEEINNYPPEQLSLSYSAGKVATELGITAPPVVISNACISGLSAIIMGARGLWAGHYKYALVVGADTVNDFVLSGFHSLLALSDAPCRPFDAARKGINLGEGASALLLELTPDNAAKGFYFSGGNITNDANHISGPSRTGEELAMAIRQTLQEAGAAAGDIDFVSAHGTATVFNDEMEAKALTIAGLAQCPTHSLKPFIGHTLGAAGIIESCIGLEIMRQGKLLASAGFEVQGTTLPVAIQTTNTSCNARRFIKTMAGFGGCNAAVCFPQITRILKMRIAQIC